MSSETAAPVAGQYQGFTHFDATLSITFDAAASKAIGGEFYRVNQPFKFYMGSESDQRWVFIPAGYLTDGATVPRIFWSLLPPWDIYGQAAVVHDYLCETLTVWDNGTEVPIVRADADRAFKEAMEVLEVPRWKRNVMYIAVRVYAKWSQWFHSNGNQSKRQYLQNLANGLIVAAPVSTQASLADTLRTPSTP